MKTKQSKRQEPTLKIEVSAQVYPFDILFLFAYSDADVDKELLEHVGEEALKDKFLYAINGKQGRTVMFSGGQTLVRMKRIPSTPYDFGTLQHEIFHVVEFIMHRVGMKLCHKSDEAYAYLIGYVTQKVYEKLT